MQCNIVLYSNYKIAEAIINKITDVVETITVIQHFQIDSFGLMLLLQHQIVYLFKSPFPPVVVGRT